MEALVAILITVLLIGFGFYLGRMTLMPPENTIYPHNPGKISIVEEDPYRVAMTGEEDMVEDVS
jgi:hypothetical protein